MSTNNVTIAVHSGSFHADDAFSVAVLKILHPNANVVRTRDPQSIATAQFAVDVGGEWVPERGRFDHHQKGFEGKRESGVIYASSGLVWRDKGAQVIVALEPELAADFVLRVAQAIDDDLVQYLDQVDTGQASPAPAYYGLAAIVDTFNLVRAERTGRETREGALAQDELELQQFLTVVGLMQTVLRRLIKRFRDQFEGEASVRSSQRTEQGRMLILKERGLAWKEVVCKEMPEVLFVLYPNSSGQDWHVQTVPVAPDSFAARVDLPETWAGLRGRELQDATGVSDAEFCHNGRFIAVAHSFEGARDLAQLALDALPT